MWIIYKAKNIYEHKISSKYRFIVIAVFEIPEYIHIYRFCEYFPFEIDTYYCTVSTRDFLIWLNLSTMEFSITNPRPQGYVLWNIKYVCQLWFTTEVHSLSTIVIWRLLHCCHIERRARYVAQTYVTLLSLRLFNFTPLNFYTGSINNKNQFLRNNNK